MQLKFLARESIRINITCASDDHTNCIRHLAGPIVNRLNMSLREKILKRLQRVYDNKLEVKKYALCEGT